MRRAVTTAHDVRDAEACGERHERRKKMGDKSEDAGVGERVEKAGEAVGGVERSDG